MFFIIVVEYVSHSTDLAESLHLQYDVCVLFVLYFSL